MANWLELDMAIGGFTRTNYLPNEYLTRVQGSEGLTHSHDFNHESPEGNNSLSSTDPTRILKSIEYNLPENLNETHLDRPWFQQGHIQSAYKRYHKEKYNSDESLAQQAKMEFLQMGRKNAVDWMKGYGLKDRIDLYKKNYQDYYAQYHPEGIEITKEIRDLEVKLDEADGEPSEHIGEQIERLKTERRNEAIRLQNYDHDNSPARGHKMYSASGKIRTDIFNQKEIQELNDAVSLATLDTENKSLHQKNLFNLLHNYNEKLPDFEKALEVHAVNQSQENKEGWQRIRALNFLGTINDSVGFESSELFNLLSYAVSAPIVKENKAANISKVGVIDKSSPSFFEGIFGGAKKYRYGDKLRAISKFDPQLGAGLVNLYQSAAENIAMDPQLEDDKSKRGQWKEVLGILDTIFHDPSDDSFLIVNQSLRNQVQIHGAYPSIDPQGDLGLVDTFKMFAMQAHDALRVDPAKVSPIFRGASDPVGEKDLFGQKPPLAGTRWGDLNEAGVSGAYHHSGYYDHILTKTVRALNKLTEADVVFGAGLIKGGSRFFSRVKGEHKQMWLGVSKALELDSETGKLHEVKEFEAMNGSKSVRIPITDNRYVFAFDADDLQNLRNNHKAFSSDDARFEAIYSTKGSAYKEENWNEFYNKADSRNDNRRNTYEWYTAKDRRGESSPIYIFDLLTGKEKKMSFDMSKIGFDQSNLVSIADPDRLLAAKIYMQIGKEPLIQGGMSEEQADQYLRKLNIDSEPSLWSN